MAGGENLGASFGIDVTNLKAGLATANKLIRESESEFKAAAAGIDDWRTSEEGLTAQIKNLTNVTGLQQQKVDALKSEYNRLIADGLDPASDQAIKLRTDINKETEALEKNKKRLKDVQGALEDFGKETDDAGDAADDAAKNVDDLGDAAKALDDGFTVAKGAIATFIGNGLTGLVNGCKNAIGALFGLAGETQEQATNMGKLETAFDTANLSAKTATDTYKNLYAVLGDEGRATETAAFLAKYADNEKELAEQTRILTGVFAEYGDSIPTEGLAEGISATIAMGETQGVLADALEWQGVNLEDFNKKLATLKTEKEREALITETLNGLYGESADKYNEVNAEVIAANKAQAEYDATIQKFGDKMRPIMTEVKEGFTDVLNAALAMVEDVDFDALAEDIKGGFDYFISDILPKIKDGLSWIKDNKDTIIAAIVGMGTAFAVFKVASLIQGVVGAIKALQAATEGMTFAQAALNLVMSMNPIGIVVAAIAGLVAAFVVLWNKCDAFREFWINLWEVVKKSFAAAWEAIKAFFTETIPAMFSNIIAWFVEFKDNIANTLKTALSSVIKWGADLIANGKKAASDFVTNVINFVKKLPGQVWTWLTNTITKVGQFVRDMKTKATEAGKGIFNNLVDAVKGLPDKMLEIGGDIVDGIWEGIKGGWDWLTRKVKNLAKDLFEAAKDALGINSPSKVFADGVGKNIALGIGQGFDENMQDVNKRVSAASAALAENSAVSTSGGSTKADTGAGNSVVVNQYNNYSQAHSRYEIYKSKQQAAAAVKLAMMGG